MSSEVTTVYLHGGLQDKRLYAAQIAALGDIRRGIALTFPGFGNTPLLHGPLNIESLAAWVLETVEAEVIDVVGLSLGAGVAVAMAEAAPHRVRSLCLSGAGGAAKKISPRAPVIAARLRAEGRAHMVPAMLTRTLAQGASLATQQLVTSMFNAASDAAIVALYELLDHYPLVMSRAAELVQPVLLVYGEEDSARPALADIPAHLRTVLIPCSGHVPPIEQPEAFNDILRGFWQELDSGALQ